MNKKLLVLLVLIFAILTGTVMAAKPTSFDSNYVEKVWESSSCTKIQDGTLLTADGYMITTGYDEWGYNYQAHMFNGNYCGSYHNPEWCLEYYKDVRLVMKWSDAWLSNEDCDGDSELDRHYGLPSYMGSGAWMINDLWGFYEQNGETCNWYYFAKIVAVPADAYQNNGYWYAADGTEIGEVMWGQFAIIQEISNDPCAGGVQIYNAPAPTGFGYYMP